MLFNLFPKKVYKIHVLGPKKGPRLEWAVYKPCQSATGKRIDWVLTKWSHSSATWKDGFVGTLSYWGYEDTPEAAWERYIRNRKQDVSKYAEQLYQAGRLLELAEKRSKKK
jgi:hypothetical protein